jgi:RHS repeat-associated protein
MGFGADRFKTSAQPGLSFFRNRVYDQSTGRWTQEDPIGIAGGVNLYQFNGNNPATYTDPFGLKADTLDVAPAMRGMVENCRTRANTCEDQLARIERSTEYVRIVRGDAAAACGPDALGGCHDPTPVQGHGPGATITIDPGDFNTITQMDGVIFNSVTAITHEAAHQNGCQGPDAEPCARRVENRARSDIRIPQVPVNP